MILEIDYKKIGKRIKHARIMKDFTQEQLAEKARLSTSHISTLESGATSMSMKTLISISNALDTSPDYLLADNIDNAKHVFQNEILLHTKDCNELEIRIIADVVKSLKTSLRERKAYFLQAESYIEN